MHSWRPQRRQTSWMWGLEQSDRESADEQTGDEEEEETVDDPVEQDEPIMPTMAELVAAAKLDENRRVVCSIEPWASMKPTQIGRITTWPEKQPYPNRSISCQCYRHSRCKSPAYKVAKAPQELLLEWLFSGKVEPGCSADRRGELRVEHLGQLKTLLDRA